MRPLFRELWGAVMLCMIVPGLMRNAALVWLEKEAVVEQEETVPAEGSEIPVAVRQGKDLVEMDLETYLVGVVLAEMPASFEEEALKAQSVAARTYTWKAASVGGKHGAASVCTESACCQAYISQADYLKKGGQQEGIEKVQNCVNATAGYVLTYEGALIDATYFSCSGGMTEDAAAVWGVEIPYLQSVSSPGEAAEGYTQVLTFTPEQFQIALERELTGTPESWFSIPTYTEGGGVAAMTIGGEMYTGTQLRNLLGLRSTVFALDITPEKIIITTKGYGHRVGMSQYGADAMAVTGITYSEILAHYYPGTVLTRLRIEESQEAEDHQ